jgi:hypothetical protein
LKENKEEERKRKMRSFKTTIVICDTLKTRSGNIKKGNNL